MSTAFKLDAPAHQPEPEVLIKAEVVCGDGFLEEVNFLIDGKAPIRVRFDDEAEMRMFFAYLASTFNTAVKFALHFRVDEHHKEVYS